MLDIKFDNYGNCWAIKAAEMLGVKGVWVEVMLDPDCPYFIVEEIAKANCLTYDCERCILYGGIGVQEVDVSRDIFG